MECWGGGGGAGRVTTLFSNGRGKGGYTYGEISWGAGEVFVYVGGRGEDMAISGSRTYKDAAGGWNGGGLGRYDRCDDDGDGGGGGATDIRLVKADESDNTVWNNFASLKSRIMVAGAGGGGGYRIHYGGCGGNATGGYAWYQESGGTKYTLTGISPGTQTSGYAFGVGQDGANNPSNINNTSAGGGGGYYGGCSNQTPTTLSSNSTHPAAGGSSYISGYTGCNAIKENAETGGAANHTGSPNHYSGKVFNHGSMINGDTSMPNPQTASKTMIGNNDSGYARITVKPYD